jgi:hypothetical protein
MKHLYGDYGEYNSISVGIFNFDHIANLRLEYISLKQY